jgi:hypothetical protein
VTYTYRDPDVLGGRPLRDVVLGDLMIGLFLVLPSVAILGFANGFTSSDRIQGLVALGLFLAMVYFGDRRHRNRVCGEIRLAEDGTCELESKRGVIRLHVNQIESVKRSNDPDSRAAYYISYQGGGVSVEKGMMDFTDFLSRLQSLNPAVDLSSFPAKTWPNLHPLATDRVRIDVIRLVRSALFPLFVITLLIYFASQMLLAK